MATFTAYFDASGTAESDVLCVAGYASTVRKWERLDEEWNEILKSEGVESFHMTDFVSSRGQYSEGWKGQSERRRLFVEKLIGCLKKNVNKCFRSALVVKDYRLVNRDRYVREMLGRPYSICAGLCLKTVSNWKLRKGIRSPILCIFEDGDQDKGDFEQRSKAHEGLNVIFLRDPNKRIVGFQAADFAGWKVRNAIANAIKEDHTVEKGAALLRSLRILRSIPSDGGVLNRVSIERVCSLMPVPARGGDINQLLKWIVKD